MSDQRYEDEHQLVQQMLLEGLDAGAMVSHLATCADCRALSEQVADLDRILGEALEPRPELLEEIVEWTRDDRLKPAPVEPAAPGRGQVDRSPITNADQFGPMTPTPWTSRLGLPAPAQAIRETRSSEQEQCAMCGVSFVPQPANPTHCPDCFRRTRRHQRN